jgi:hypothetical protein
MTGSEVWAVEMRGQPDVSVFRVVVVVAIVVGVIGGVLI